MGDKTAARALAHKLKVPTLPGTEEPITDPRRGAHRGPRDRLSAHHQGGLRRRRPRHARGARSRRNSPGLLAEAQQRGAQRLRQLRRSSSSATSHRAKHIEVQILGDQHGNVVHLHERDCSVQRRHQKVIEVAPSVDLDPTRSARTSATPRCDSPRGSATTTPAPSSSSTTWTRNDWFFIEMNPRIQVEHTVTEAITGIDLVRSQILIAAGRAAARRGGRASRRRSEIPVQRLRHPVPHHHRGSGERISRPTTAASSPTARPPASASASTPPSATPARSSRRTTTRCW